MQEPVDRTHAYLFIQASASLWAALLQFVIGRCYIRARSKVYNYHHSLEQFAGTRTPHFTAEVEQS